MRVSFITLLPIVVALASWVNAYSDGPLDAREYVDELSTRELEYIDRVFERRDLLADISSRDLMDELLERRAGNPLKPKPKTYGCPYCGTQYRTEAEAKHCATNPQMLGGCKVNQPVVQGGGTSKTSLKKKGKK